MLVESGMWRCVLAKGNWKSGPGPMFWKERRRTCARWGRAWGLGESTKCGYTQGPSPTPNGALGARGDHYGLAAGL